MSGPPASPTDAVRWIPPEQPAAEESATADARGRDRYRPLPDTRTGRFNGSCGVTSWTVAPCLLKIRPCGKSDYALLGSSGDSKEVAIGMENFVIPDKAFYRGPLR